MKEVGTKDKEKERTTFLQKQIRKLKETKMKKRKKKRERIILTPSHRREVLREPQLPQTGLTRREQREDSVGGWLGIELSRCV